MEFQLLQDIPNCMWELFIAQALCCLTVLDFRDDSVDLEVSFSIFTVRAFKATLQPKKPKYDPKSMDVWIYEHGYMTLWNIVPELQIGVAPLISLALPSPDLPQALSPA